MWTSDAVAQVRAKLQRWLSLADQGAFAELAVERVDLIQTLISAVHEPLVRDLALELGLKVDTAMRWRGYWDAWYATLLNLLLAAQVLGDRAAQARLWERVGALCNLRGEPERAMAAHQTTLGIVPELGRAGDAVAAWALAGLIDDARRRNAPKEALTYVPLALSQARRAGDRAALANAHMVSANVYGEICDWRHALECAQLAYVYWRRVKDEVGEAKALHILGIVYQAMGRLDQAMRVTQRAAAIYRTAGSNYLLGLLNVLQGNLYEDLDDWLNAERYYRSAVTRLEEHPSTFDLAVAQVNLGVALAERRRWAEAERYLLAALDAWRRLSTDGQCVRTLYALGDMYANWGLRDNAITYLEEVLSKAEALPPDAELESMVASAREWLNTLTSD